MRPSNKRSRNKSGNSGNNYSRQRVGNIINRVFESAGPEGRVRGTPQQIIEKYTALARDAQLSNDRVAAESFQQHAEHYNRLLGEAQLQQAEQQRGGEGRDEQRDDGQRGDNRDDGQRGDNSPRGEGRDDGQRGEGQRGEGQRGEGRDEQRGDDGQRGQGRDNQRGQGRDDQRGEGRDDGQRDQSRDTGGAGLGLATIDPRDDDGETGPVDTPEDGRRNDAPQHREGSERRSEPQAPRDAEANGAAHAAAGSGEPAPAKRPRTRRKAPRPEAEAKSEAPAD